MTDPSRAAARAAAALFCAYFAFVGVFSPYLSLFLSDRGMTIAQIGMLMALPQAVRIIGPPVWGWAAGHVAGEPAVLRLAAIAAVLSIGALAGADGFAGLAAALFAVCFATSGMVPIAEALTLRAVSGDLGGYGRVRVWGSIGFIGAVAVAGPLLDRYGMRLLPACLLALMGALAVIAFRLPNQAPKAAVGARARLRERIREPAIAAFFVSSALMIFAHAGLYAFYSLYLELHGYTRSLIGLMWAIGVMAEIVLFFGQRRLFTRFGALSLLSFSFVVCVLRFALIASVDGNPGWLVVAQLMHAVTFGLHQSASMAMLHHWFAGPGLARAQAAFAVASYGIGGTLGGLAASWAWDYVSPAGVFALAAASAAVGWIAVAACRRFEYARAHAGAAL